MEKNIIWFTVLLSTLFIQIIFMNMLIAIMKDIFDNVMKDKEQSAMKERLELLEDLESVLNMFSQDSKKEYLLVVKPKNVQRDVSSVEARISSLKNFMQD